MVAASALGELSVLDRQGNEVLLASVWQDRTTVLAFVRHFG
jgi:hypothetical protein